METKLRPGSLDTVEEDVGDALRPGELGRLCLHLPIALTTRRSTTSFLPESARSASVRRRLSGMHDGEAEPEALFMTPDTTSA